MGRQIVAITDALTDQFWQAAPTVIERYLAHRRADRRETTVLTLLAGFVPLLGLVVFGWAPGTAAGATLLNLALLLIDDLVKSGLATGTWRELHQQAMDDHFVWRFGAALMNRAREVGDSIVPGTCNSYLSVGELLALVTLGLALTGFVLFLMTGPGAALPIEPLLWGSLPNLGLILASYVIGVRVRHPHWRRAGSAR